jgi:DNA-binding transcriptional LysR family regulator
MPEQPGTSVGRTWRRVQWARSGGGCIPPTPCTATCYRRVSGLFPAHAGRLWVPCPWPISACARASSCNVPGITHQRWPAHGTAGWSTCRVDIQQIRYFVAVADELHFGRAAERLHVTPSSFSRRIRELEHELGSDLFVREYHNVKLTRFGQDFLEPARDVVGRFDGLRRLSRDPEGLSLRRCRIGATPLAAPHVLDVVLDMFQKTEPDVELPISLAPTAELVDMLASDEVDLAVVHLPVDTRGLESLPLARGGYSVAMRDDDALAHRTSLTLRDLANRQVLATSGKVHPSFMGAVRDRLIAAGVARIVELPLNDAVQVAAHIQRTGMPALTLGSRHHPAARIYDAPGFTLVPLVEPDLVALVGVVWHPETQRRLPSLTRVLAALRERYGEENLNL